MGSQLPGSSSQSFIAQWGLWALLCSVISMFMLFGSVVGQAFEYTKKPTYDYNATRISSEKFSTYEYENIHSIKYSSTRFLWKSFGNSANLLASIAIFFSSISISMREKSEFNFYATALSLSTISYDFFWWLTVLIYGILLLKLLPRDISDNQGAR